MACPREEEVVVAAVVAATPAPRMTIRNPRRYCQFPLPTWFAAWPSHPLHDRPMPENLAWRYVVYLNSSLDYIPGLRCSPGIRRYAKLLSGNLPGSQKMAVSAHAECPHYRRDITDHWREVESVCVC